MLSMYRLEKAYLGFSAFLLGISLFGLLLAEFGVFNGGSAVTGGFVALGLLLFLVRKVDGIPDKIGKATCLFLLGLIIYALFLFLPPFNWILGSQDPGGYVNTAVELSRTGSLRFGDPVVVAASQAGPATDVFFPWGKQVYLPAFYIYRGAIVPQFYHMYPVLLSCAYSLLGLKAALCVTPLLALLNSFGLFLIIRRWFHTHFTASIAVVMFVTNVAFVWWARFANSEMLALNFLLSGYLALCIYEQCSSRNNVHWWAILSAAMLGAAFLTRISMIYLFPALAVGWLMLHWKYKFRYSIPWLLTLAVFTSWTFIHAVFFSFPYFHDVFVNTGVAPFLQAHKTSAVLFSIVLFVLAMAYIWALKSGNSARKLIAACIERSRPLVVPAMVFLVAGVWVLQFVYDRKMPTWMEWYCGLPILFLASIGLIAWAKNIAEGSDIPISFAVFLLADVTAAGLLALQPYVNPVHFWASRRLLVFVFPLVFLFAAHGFTYAYRWTGRAGGAILLAIALIPGIYNLEPVVGFQMFGNAGKDLEQFSKAIPQNSIVLFQSKSNLALIATPLHFIYQKTVLPVQDDVIPGESIEWLKSNFPDRQIYIATADQSAPRLSLPYAASQQPIAGVPINWAAFRGETDRLPRGSGSVRGRLELWQLRVSENAGVRKVAVNELQRLGVQSRGIYDLETSKGDYFAWTNGHAELSFPRALVNSSRKILVTLSDARKKPVETEILLNSHRLGTIQVTGQRTVFFSKIPADWLGSSKDAVLEINTPAWIPAEVTASTDTRELGVQLFEIQFEE